MPPEPPWTFLGLRYQLAVWQAAAHAAEVRRRRQREHAHQAARRARARLRPLRVGARGCAWVHVGARGCAWVRVRARARAAAAVCALRAVPPPERGME